jgi:hypothetical protein
MPVPTDGDIKKMATRKPPIEIKTVVPVERLQQTTRMGRALQTALCEVARKSRSDAAKIRACELLGVLEGHWTTKDLHLLESPRVVTPKVGPEVTDKLVEELRTDGGEKVQKYLPTGSEGMGPEMLALLDKLK